MDEQNRNKGNSTGWSSLQSWSFHRQESSGKRRLGGAIVFQAEEQLSSDNSTPRGETKRNMTLKTDLAIESKTLIERSASKKTRQNPFDLESITNKEESVLPKTRGKINKPTFVEITVPGEIPQESVFEESKEKSHDPTSIHLSSSSLESTQKIKHGKSKTTVLENTKHIPNKNMGN